MSVRERKRLGMSLGIKFQVPIVVAMQASNLVSDFGIAPALAVWAVVARVPFHATAAVWEDEVAKVEAVQAMIAAQLGAARRCAEARVVASARALCGVACAPALAALELAIGQLDRLPSEPAAPSDNPQGAAP